MDEYRIGRVVRPVPPMIRMIDEPNARDRAMAGIDLVEVTDCLLRFQQAADDFERASAVLSSSGALAASLLATRVQQKCAAVSSNDLDPPARAMFHAAFAVRAFVWCKKDSVCYPPSHTVANSLTNFQAAQWLIPLMTMCEFPYQLLQSN